jgi:hypothetical protein
LSWSIVMSSPFTLTKDCPAFFSLLPQAEIPATAINIKTPQNMRLFDIEFLALMNNNVSTQITIFSLSII